MKGTIQESSTTGSAKIHAQHTKNTYTHTPREEARTDSGTVRKDTTSVQDKNPHPGSREWS